ncbi:glycosyltransferase family 2 protein [Acidobacteriota bacterium]
MNISAVLIVRNEEKKLDAALKSLQDVVDEIIVVDSCSTDDTVKIAKRYTNHVFEKTWTNYAEQKNYANQKASHEWILSLDADERLSDELAAEIKTLKSSVAEPVEAGFSMPRQVFYLGRWIRHSAWYPDRKVRLFRKDQAAWEGEYIHESLVIKGDVRRLNGVLHHFTYNNIRDHLDRINQFSDLAAQKLYAANKKSRGYHLILLPFLGFIKSFFLKAGILDGFAGLVISILHGYSVFIRYAKLKEIWKKGERIEPFSN